jgi:peptidoglycan/LPS O-acetylase OafA/YrhL
VTIIRNDIQILRGIAVLVVVLFHLQFTPLANGFLGVDIFFVISGFLMAKLYRQGTRLDFYRRRVDRLLPAYALTVMATLIVASLFVIPVDFWQLAGQSYASSVFMSNLYFWSLNSYFDNAAFKPLLNLWSLAVEVQFYFLVPFLFPLLEKRKLWTIILICVSLILCILAQTVSPKISFFLLPFRMWEFLAGAWVAWYKIDHGYSNRALNLRRMFWAVLMFAVFILIPVEPSSRSILTGHPSVAALLAVLATAKLIELGMPLQLMQSPAGKILTKIGDYSYSIYLVHFPLIVLWNYAPFDGTILKAATYGDLAGIAVAIAVFSLLSYQLIETRFSGVFKNATARVGLPLLIAATAFATQFLNTNSYSETDQRIFSAWTDRSPYRCGKMVRITQPTQQICLIGNDVGTQSILLLGNSHADSIKTSTAKLANKAGKNLYFLVENRPLLDSDKDGSAILKEASTLKISAIIIHFNNIYKDVKSRDRILDFIKSAKALGIKIAVMAPVPYYDQHVPKELFLHGPKSVSLRMNASQYEERIVDFLNFKKQLAALDIKVYDPALVFCPSRGSCITTDDAMVPFYYDPGHLTLTGAVKLEGMIGEILSSFE